MVRMFVEQNNDKHIIKMMMYVHLREAHNVLRIRKYLALKIILKELVGGIIKIIERII